MASKCTLLPQKPLNSTIQPYPKYAAHVYCVVGAVTFCCCVVQYLALRGDPAGHLQGVRDFATACLGLQLVPPRALALNVA